MVQTSSSYFLAAIAVSAAYVAAAPAPKLGPNAFENAASLGSQYLQSRQQPNYDPMMRRGTEGADAGAVFGAVEAALAEEEQAALNANEQSDEAGKAQAALAVAEAEVAAVRNAANVVRTATDPTMGGAEGQGSGKSKGPQRRRFVFSTPVSFWLY